MKKLIGFLLVWIALGGCAKHVRTEIVTGPNGKPAIAMRCGNMPACYKEAGERCPNGYDILDQTTVLRGRIIEGFGGLSTQGSMLIQCKE